MKKAPSGAFFMDVGGNGGCNLWSYTLGRDLTGSAQRGRSFQASQNCKKVKVSGELGQLHGLPGHVRSMEGLYVPACLEIRSDSILNHDPLARVET